MGGKRLKQLMEQRGVTQEELSGATGVPTTPISRLWWGAIQKPDLYMMSRIYGAFGLSPNRAAEDYGCYRSSMPLDDPRLEDIDATLRMLPPEQREQLISQIYLIAKLFLEEIKSPNSK